MRGRREAGGERLAGRLLWEAPPSPPADECFLFREREEERREEEEKGSGERLRERAERRDMGLVLEDRRLS